MREVIIGALVGAIVLLFIGVDPGVSLLSAILTALLGFLVFGGSNANED